MLSKIILAIVRLFISGHGFNAKKTRKQINKDGDHYLFGANNVPMEIIRPNGQYDKDLPADELQNMNGVETWNCPSYGTHNALQILVKAKYDRNFNWSERFTGVLANIIYGFGGSPHTAAEVFRLKGAISDSLLPFTNKIKTWWQYMSPKPMSQDLLDEGEKWLDQYELKHEWVTNLTPEGMMQALKYSPLGVGIYAWYKNNEGYYDNPGRTDQHWTVCYGYEKGKYWKGFDSYDNTHKKIAWNYPWKFVKRYHISAKSTDVVAEGKKLLNKIEGKYILRSEANGEMYKVTKDRLIYCLICINNKELRDEFNSYLRVKENFIGISEKDFNNLSTAVVVAGGKVDKPIDLKGLID